jgi:hypothetical protein
MLLVHLVFGSLFCGQLDVDPSKLYFRVVLLSLWILWAVLQLLLLGAGSEHSLSKILNGIVSWRVSRASGTETLQADHIVAPHVSSLLRHASLKGRNDRLSTNHVLRLLWLRSFRRPCETRPNLHLCKEYCIADPKPQNKFQVCYLSSKLSKLIFGRLETC